MRRDKWIWLAALALGVLLWSGCAGVLSEKMDDSGQTETLRLSSGSQWSKWDKHSTKEDDTCVILKKESTF
jgi:hypothetical protein